MILSINAIIVQINEHTAYIKIKLKDIPKVIAKAIRKIFKNIVIIYSAFSIKSFNSGNFSTSPITSGILLISGLKDSIYFLATE